MFQIRIVTIILLSALCPLVFSAEVSQLSLMNVQEQIESPFHAKRTFRFLELAPSSTDGGGLFNVSSEELGLECRLSSRGGYFPSNAYALSFIEFNDYGFRIILETYKNFFLSKAFAFIDCEVSDLDEVSENAIKSLLLSDFIEFFYILRPSNQGSISNEAEPVGNIF